MARPLEVETIVRARQLLSDPNKWCEGVLARTYFGIPCSPTIFFAKRFCARGALAHEAYKLTGNRALAWRITSRAEAMVCPLRSSHSLSLAGINDTYGRERVLKVLGRVPEFA